MRSYEVVRQPGYWSPHDIRLEAAGARTREVSRHRVYWEATELPHLLFSRLSSPLYFDGQIAQESPPPIYSQPPS